MSNKLSGPQLKVLSRLINEGPILAYDGASRTISALMKQGLVTQRLVLQTEITDYGKIVYREES